MFIAGQLIRLLHLRIGARQIRIARIRVRLPPPTGDGSTDDIRSAVRQMYQIRTAQLITPIASRCRQYAAILVGSQTGAMRTASNVTAAAAIGHLLDGRATVNRPCRRARPAELRQRQLNGGRNQFDAQRLDARLMGGNQFQARVELDARHVNGRLRNAGQACDLWCGM